MFNLFIFLFIIYYIIFIIHVRNYIHFYELLFSIYQSKLVSYFFKHSYTTITILELVNHFTQRITKSHISKLMNYRNLPEAFQHARTAAKNPKDYYHVSAEKQGYDAFSFNKNNFQKLITEKDISLMTIHEKKTVIGNVSNYIKIPKIVKKYSVSRTEGLDQANQGARPGPVDQLEFKTFSTEDYNILKNILKNSDLSRFKKPSVIIEDYSNTYAKIVLNPKHGGFGEGTLINDSAFEHLKWFYNFLDNNEEMCSYMNDLLEKNPFFPLSL